MKKPKDNGSITVGWHEFKAKIQELKDFHTLGYSNSYHIWPCQSIPNTNGLYTLTGEAKEPLEVTLTSTGFIPKFKLDSPDSNHLEFQLVHSVHYQAGMLLKQKPTVVRLFQDWSQEAIIPAIQVSYPPHSLSYAFSSAVHAILHTAPYSDTFFYFNHVGEKTKLYNIQDITLNWPYNSNPILEFPVGSITVHTYVTLSIQWPPAWHRGEFLTL